MSACWACPMPAKSTFIRAVSAATPKVADYPFTTLHPNLGVVRVDNERSFVIADIPGLIEGAAEGAGLGHQLSRHLQRTRLLLHLVDIAPIRSERRPGARCAGPSSSELRKYDPGAVPETALAGAEQDRPDTRRRARSDGAAISCANCDRSTDRCFMISAITGEGCKELTYAIMEHLEQNRRGQRSDRRD